MNGTRRSQGAGHLDAERILDTREKVYFNRMFKSEVFAARAASSPCGKRGHPRFKRHENT